MICRLKLISFILFCLVSPLTLEEKVTVVTWEMTQELNYETGEMPDNLKHLNNQTVEVSGFIVPLQLGGYLDMIKEFVLVPNPLACIHVPPPPPNQMIYVTMNKEIPLDMDYRGVSIKGTLKFSKPTEMYNFYGMTLDGVSAKEANIEYEDPFLDLIDNLP